MAYAKAKEICADIFDDEITVCIIRIFGGKSLLSVLSVLRDLRHIGLYPPVTKQHWKDKDDEDPEWDSDDLYWHTIALTFPKRDLNKLLWCSLAADLGIRPCPHGELLSFRSEKIHLSLPL